jgi:tetratricopeptide (TPR) repeat protein
MKTVMVLVVSFSLAMGPLSAQSATATVPGLGTLTMVTSAQSDSAQRSFLKGVLLLHLFEYSRAAEAFREAEKLEPDFAMAYWGEAMTYTHPVWNQQDVGAARAVLARLGSTPAARAEKAPTAREKAYLGTLDLLYGDGPKAHRDTLYSQAMDHLVQTYPGDNQAHLFYALSLLGLSQGVRVVPTYLRAAAIADSALAREPHNPGAAHYLIHGVDDPDHASQGLKAARVLLETATDAGHGQHMASHIFMALGMWDDVVAANENAVRVVDEQAAAAGRPPAACGHYPSWLEYGYLSQGRVTKARKVLEACHQRAVAAKGGGAASDPDNSTVGSYVMMWARYLLDTGDWEGDVAKWNVDTSANPYAALTDAFVRGFGAARRGDPAGAESARQAYGSLQKRLDRMLAARATDDPGAGELMKRLQVLGLELEASSSDASGDAGGVVRLLERATAIEDAMAFAFGPPFVDEPSFELLGEVLLARHHPQRAADAFRAALTRAKLRPRSLLGLARASAAAGDVAGAARAYGALVKIWHAADRDLPGLAEAQAYAAAHPVSGEALLLEGAGG